MEGALRGAVWLGLLGVAACGGEGTWDVEVYGEPFIEEGMPAEVFADGCSATFTTFDVVVAETALLDGDGAMVVSEGARVFDLVTPGPHALTTLSAGSGFYDQVRFRIGPASDAEAGNIAMAESTLGTGDAMAASGTLTCGADTVTFDWAFQSDTSYLCGPEDLTIPAGGTDGTQLTVHGDHFFYDGLSNDDAEVRGQAIVDADADSDGEVTLDELAAVSVAPLGYQVGPFAEVTDLRAFISNLTGSLGHVDGEGHCDVSRN